MVKKKIVGQSASKPPTVIDFVAIQIKGGMFRDYNMWVHYFKMDHGIVHWYLTLLFQVYLVMYLVSRDHLPGPLSLGMDKMMIDAMSKGESFEFQFSKYQHLFKDTYGLFAYQEQLMQLSGEMCGFDAIKQDVLRKATGKTINFLISRH